MLVAGLLGGAAGTAAAADGFIQLSSAAQLDGVITPWFETVGRQRFSQTLAASLRRILVDGDRELLSLSLRGRLETDFGRPVFEGDDDPRVAEPVDWVLVRAQLDWRPEEGWLVRGGRQLVVGTLAARDLDGGLVEGGLGGWWFRLAGGREVRPDRGGLDDDLFDAAGLRWEAFGGAEPDPTWLGQGETGFALDSARGGVGHRLTWRHGDRVGQQTGGHVELMLPVVTARLRGRWDHLMERPERLDGQVALPVARVGAVWAGWREVAPTFDGDSLFVVFSSSPWVEWRVGAELTPATRWGVNVVGRLRGFGEDGEIPWAAGLDGDGEMSRGVELSAWGTPWARLDLRGSVSADAGHGGLAVGSAAAARWAALPPDLELGVYLRHLYRESDEWAARYGHLLAARGYGSYALSSFGRAAVWVDFVSDFRFGRTLQVMAVAEFDLGPL